ncbi:putative RNA-binding protein 18-like, partial [Trifolium medium]|nr:putative RNA-binding protein 18-like [Trifolium medium]
AALLKMFNPYGKIVSEDFLWHTRGPKRGEPRGFAFIQYSTKETPASSTKAVGEGHKLHLTGGGIGQTSRSAKIAAIKNKLKSLEEDNSRTKKQKQSDNIS